MRPIIFSRSSGLNVRNVPSKTALCIYRKLAVYTYRLIPEGGFYESDIVAELDNNKLKTIPLKMQKKCKMPMRKDVIDCINRICSSEGEFDKIIEEVLFENGQVSEKRCKEISDCLMNANKELYTSAQDQAKAWRTISLSNNGHPKLIVARMPDEKKSRVQKILEGSLQVEKSDMLHLLWFLFNLSWLEHPICDTNELFNSLADYTETVKMVLDKALLPAFYPPHIMEQSMLLSIVESVSDAGSPADVRIRYKVNIKRHVVLTQYAFLLKNPKFLRCYTYYTEFRKYGKGRITMKNLSKNYLKKYKKKSEKKLKKKKITISVPMTVSILDISVLCKVFCEVILQGRDHKKIICFIIILLLIWIVKILSDIYSSGL